MEWLKWGKQSNIFGFPIALILILEGIVNITGVKDLRFLFLPTRITHVFMGLGTTSSLSVTDFVRAYLISKLLICILWGFLTLLNVFVLKKSTWIAYITFSLSCIFYVTFSTGIIYGAILYINGDYMEFNPALSDEHLSSPIPWPAHFWVNLFYNIIVTLILSIVVLDTHLSYINIVKAGGTGWEYQSYFQIEKQKQETVDETTPLTRRI